MSDLEDELISYGYSHLREVEGRGKIGLLRFIYTWGVCYGIDSTGYTGRVCFDNPTNAVGFVDEWDGINLPPIGEDGVTAHK